MSLTLGQLRKSKIAILGWGVNNRDLLAWLQDRGVEDITVLDKDKSVNPPVKAILGKGYLDNLGKFDIVVRTPGISYFHPLLLRAQNRDKVIVTSQTELFLQFCPCPVIGITGSKGKSTLASVITHILRQNGKSVFLAGNIGVNPFGFINQLTSASFVVYELSSFQLEGLSQSPQIAVVLPIVVEHLDYHLDMAHYLDAKLNIVRNQNVGDALIISKFDKANAFIQATKAKVIKINANLPQIKTRLLGKHNQFLLAYALTLSNYLQLDREKTLRAIHNFLPLEHRLEIVGRKHGVVFVNDSQATTPESAIAGLHALGDKKLIWLGGGKSKGADYSHLGEEINRHARVAICFGQDAILIHEHIFLKKNFLVNTLSEAFKIAQKMAKAGDWVLFSPGATSLDQFKNAKERGIFFKKLVNRG